MKKMTGAKSGFESIQLRYCNQKKHKNVGLSTAKLQNYERISKM